MNQIQELINIIKEQSREIAEMKNQIQKITGLLESAEQKKLQKQAEREAKKAEREQKKAEKLAEREQKKAEKLAEREAKKLQKQAEREQKKAQKLAEREAKKSQKQVKVQKVKVEEQKTEIPCEQKVEVQMESVKIEEENYDCAREIKNAEEKNREKEIQKQIKEFEKKKIRLDRLNQCQMVSDEEYSSEIEKNEKQIEELKQESKLISNLRSPKMNSRKNKSITDKRIEIMKEQAEENKFKPILIHCEKNCGFTCVKINEMWSHNKNCQPQQFQSDNNPKKSCEQIKEEYEQKLQQLNRDRYCTDYEYKQQQVYLLMRVYVYTLDTVQRQNMFEEKFKKMGIKIIQYAQSYGTIISLERYVNEDLCSNVPLESERQQIKQNIYELKKQLKIMLENNEQKKQNVQVKLTKLNNECSYE